MNPISITQGRLSPPTEGKIQAFPVDTWRKEFVLASEANLDCIEWVYQVSTENRNPLRTDEGVAEIRNIMSDTGIEVSSVTADYYMAERLVAENGTPRPSAIQHLKWLLARASLVKAKYVMVAFVDGGSLKSSEEHAALPAVLQELSPVLDATNVELHMETDLKPELWAEILTKAPHPKIRVCYDIGDRASQGFGPGDFHFLGPWLGSVHIKDRVLGGGSVPLGTGDADISACFRCIHDLGYDKPFVLQTAREEKISELELAVRNREYIEKITSVL